MKEFKKFENTEQRQVFFKILKKFGRDFLFLGLVILGGLWGFGILGKTNHHYACDAEMVKSKNRKAFFFKDGNYFTGGDLVSQDFAFEGKNSLRLEGENAYAFQINYEYLIGNEEVVVWVWRFAEGDWKSSGQVVATVNNKFWKSSNEVIETKDSGWEKIQLKFQVPEQTSNEIMSIYCWNAQTRPIYFDDFHLVIQEKEDL